MVNTRSAGCIIGVMEGLQRITPNRFRFFGWLQRRALMARSMSSAACTNMPLASLKATLKRCGGTSSLPPKGIHLHPSPSPNITSKAVVVFVRTRLQPFAGTGAPKQRATLTLHASYKS